MDFEPKLWNIFFILKGPGGTVEAPNTRNPVSCINIEGLCLKLSGEIPPFGKSFGVELVGLRIEQVTK